MASLNPFEVSNPKACWIWHGRKLPNGYGTFNFYNSTNYAHRASWQIFRGLIPKGLLVCHRCDNPACVNPDHLWLGTVQENIQDKTNKGRQTAGEKSYNAKLTNKDVLEIRRLYKAGLLNQRQMGIKLGVSTGTIHHVAHGRNWKHVK